MFSNNVTKFLLNMIKDGKLEIDLTDEIIRDTLVTDDGDVVHERLRSILNLPPLVQAEDAEAEPNQEPNGNKEQQVGSPDADDSDDRLDVGDLTAGQSTEDENVDVAEDAETDDDSDDDDLPSPANETTEPKH
jgi:hypothetical protein